MNRFHYDALLGDDLMIVWANRDNRTLITDARDECRPQGTANEVCCCVEGVERSRDSRATGYMARSPWTEICTFESGAVGSDGTHAWSRVALECTGDTVSS